jgi:2-oxo-4-hydroxy-4-carboxy-5-ureidoimidazoline decarboxylase
MERWQRIDEASAPEAVKELGICCASRRWTERMLARRPFGSLDAAQAAAQEEWLTLAPSEWKEAFAHHPRVGDIAALRARFGADPASSLREQAGVESADASVLQALLEANREYERRFGYIFIVCATGKTAKEMLDLLRSRLRNEPSAEILVAAAEHARICDVRLGAVV